MTTNSDKIVNFIIDLIENKKLNPGDYMNLVAVIIQEVDQLDSKTGLEKKQLAKDILNSLIQHTDIFGEEIKSILTEATIDNLIEVIVNIAKGRYKIKERFKKLKRFWNNLKFKCTR